MADKKKQELTVKISPSIILFVFLFLAGIWLVGQIKNILFMAFIAYIISVGLNKPIASLQKKFKWKRIISTLFVYLVFITLLITFLAFLLPPLISEFSSMVIGIKLPPELAHQLYNFELDIQNISELWQQFNSSIGAALDVLISTFSGFFLILSTIIMALFMSLERSETAENLAWLTHNKKKLQQIEDFVLEMDAQLGNWIRGEFILMSIIGLMTFVGNALIGVPYALPLAILAGLTEIIPNIGPLVAMIPAVAIALLGLGLPGGIATLVLYILIQQLENNLIVPRVMKKNVDVSGLTSILGILIGGQLFGIVGALLAVPLFIVIRTGFENWRKYSKSGDLI